MFEIGERVKVIGKDFDSGIIQLIHSKTVELWCSKGYGVRVSKKNIRRC